MMGRWKFALATIALVGAVGMAKATRAETKTNTAGDWPRWRGPQENGHAVASDLPTRWDESAVAWKVRLPGVGQSSPIVSGERIFLTSELGGGRERLVYAVDRNTGKVLWQHTAWTGEPEKAHLMNGWASATCATDGEVVVAFFGRGGLHAYTVAGKPLWSLNLGQFVSPWGTAACPIMLGDMVIQNGDADEDACLLAVDKRTGKILWRTKRPDNRGWSTPILIHANGHDELVLNGHDGLKAYDPKTGGELWSCRGFNGRGEPTVTPAGELLFAVNGLTGDCYAVRPGGKGDVTATHMAWHTPRKGGRDCPSPIVVGNRAMVVAMNGIITSYDATTGKEEWKERLDSKFSASPIAANGLAYFLDEAGRTLVIRPGAKLDIVAENKLKGDEDEIFRASITPSQGQLFIRSTTHLYCIGPRNTAAAR